MTSSEGQQHITENKKHKKDKKKEKMFIDQIEFYFGDVNLSKDKFLSELINESPDGYVEVSVFLKFNKIKTLTDSAEEIANALTKSTFLKVSEDRKFVKRITPIRVNDQVDQCTIYVENLPHHADHEWVKDCFKSFGKVTYVSLPKFRTSGRIKGFAFVEFESVEEAENACKSFAKNTETVKTEYESQASQTTVKREIESVDESPKKKKKIEEIPVKKELRVKREIEDDGGPARKKKKTEELPVKEVKMENEMPKKKKIDELVKKEEDEEQVAVEGKKGRKNKKGSKTKKKIAENKLLNLRVISKLEWKRYRNKYLSLQKANMTQIKKYLVLQNKEKAEFENPVEEVKASTTDLQFIPNVVIKLNLSEPIRDSKPLRNELKSLIGVRYVDLKDDTVCGYVRCDCAEIAESVLESVKLKGEAFIIQDEEEKMYWNKITEDRNKKHNTKHHPKKRGFNKIMHKVININHGITANHIRFDDE